MGTDQPTKIDLKIAEGYPRDAWRAIARIHEDHMKTLGVTLGDFIEITMDGKKIIAKCLPLSPGEPKGVIRIDGEISRLNGFTVGDSVTIKKGGAYNVALPSVRNGPAYHTAEIEKARLLEEMKKADGSTKEAMRSQVEELDWLINEGGNPRTKEEVDAEYKRLAVEKEKLEGFERLKLESRFAALRMAANYLFFENEMRTQMVRSRGIVEKYKSQEEIIQNTELVENKSESLELEIESKAGKTIRSLLFLPKDELKPEKLPTIIILHDLDGVTKHIVLTAKRLAAVGYAAVVPFVQLSSDNFCR